MKVVAGLKFRLGAVWCVVGLLATGACSSEPTATADAAVESDTGAGTDATTTADTGADAAADVATCEKSCKTPQGQEDVSLCGDVQKFTCNAGCCVPKFVCKADADCAPRLGQPECADTRFTCTCDVENGVCLQGQCTKNEQCGTGKICSQGGCIAAPAANGLHARLLRRAMVGKPAQVVDLAVDLGAQAVDDKGNVVAGATFTFNVTGANAPTPAAGKITLPAAAGDLTVTAKVDGGDGKDSNPAIIHGLGAAGSGLRVAAFDEETLAALSGKVVVVGLSANATPEAAVTMDLAGGQASFASVKFPADIHVFPADHAPVSVLGYQPDGASGEVIVTSGLVHFANLALADDGSLVKEKILDPENGKEVHPGTKLVRSDVLTGTIEYSGIGEASLGLSSLAFGNGLLNFSIESILGPNVTRKFDKDAPTFLNPGSYNEVPGGVTFGLGKPVITKYLLAGTPGSHKLWTLAGHIELATLYAQIGKVFDAIDGGVDIGKIVSVLLPYLSTFYSQVVLDVQFGETVSSPIHELNLKADQPQQYPLLVKTVLTPPKLPSLGDGTHADLLFGIGGALLPSGEIVPLGLTAASDKNEKADPSDGVVDGDPESAGDQSTLTLAMAPLHSGLQVGAANHVIVSAAVVIAGTTKDADGKVLTDHQEGGSIQITEPGVAPSSLTLADFLPIPVGSVFDPAAGTIKVVDIKGADFYRVTFPAAEGTNWTVVLPKSAIGTAFKLPDIKALGADQDYRATAKQANVGAFVLKTTQSLNAVLGSGLLTDLVRSVKQTSFTNAKL